MDSPVAFTWAKVWPLSNAVHTWSPAWAIWAGVGETSSRRPPTWRLSSAMTVWTSAAVGVRRATLATVTGTVVAGAVTAVVAGAVEGVALAGALVVGVVALGW